MGAQGSMGPFCQSCGMPLEKPEDFGTEDSGFRVNDYCRFCFAGGAFTEPDVSMPQMAAKCASIMASQGMMSATEARNLMADVLPRLKRWRAPATPAR